MSVDTSNPGYGTRNDALQAASRMYSSVANSVSPDVVLRAAKLFEDYLKGNK